VLHRLRHLPDVDTTLRSDEARLCEDAKDGKLKRWTFADAALLASGVRNLVRREALRQRIEDLTDQARQATATGNSPREKAEQLLRWLHVGPLAGGYRPDQNDFAVLLKQRTFNSVSSAVLYHVLAQRLALDVRAVGAPGYVFCVLCDGAQRFDVLTAIPGGFDPSHDPTQGIAFIRQTGLRHVEDSEKSREVGEVGLLALLWYHRGLELARGQRYPEALSLFFRALLVDPGLHAATQSTLNVMAFWCEELAVNGEFEKALSIAAAGLELAPRDALLWHVQRSAWINRARSMLEAGQDEAALALLRQAALTLADRDCERMQAWIFVRKAEGLAEKSHWREALAVLESGFSRLSGVAEAELSACRVDLFERWARAETPARHFERAVAIIAEGLRRAPKDRRLTHALDSTIEQWTAFAHQSPGHADLLLLIADLNDSNATVRRAAADGLKSLGDRAAVPALKRRIADQLWVSTPPSNFSYSRQDTFDGFHELGSKDHALAALRALAPEEVKDALRQAVQSPNPKVRDWAEKESSLLDP
jgi:tetratricopeptide (TPR) repeat protein